MNWKQYETDSFFGTLYQNGVGADFAACPPEQFADFAQKKRAALSDALSVPVLRTLTGQLEGPRTVPEQTTHSRNIRIDHHTLHVAPGLCVPLYVLTPSDQSPCGTVLYCQPHGNTFTQSLMAQKGDEPLACDDDSLFPIHSAFELRLARAGFRVVMPELMGFGASVRGVYKQPEDAGCRANSASLLLHGLSMAGVRVYECMLALDFIKAHFGGQRVAAYGMSGGGLVLTLLSALENRLCGACVASYLNLMPASIGAMNHCFDNYVPGAFSIGDAPHILSLAAPTPLYITSGTQDPIFPIEATRQAIRIVASLYEKAGAPACVQVDLFEGGHEILPDTKAIAALHLFLAQ